MMASTPPAAVARIILSVPGDHGEHITQIQEQRMNKVSFT